MKNKTKLPVFMELTFVSLGIITTILIVYMFIQLISLNFFSIDYQKEQIRNKYHDIELLLSYANIEEDKFINLNEFIKGREEFIRIYQGGTIHYFTPSNVWDNIPLSVEDIKLKTYTQLIQFKRYIILDSPISINDTDYRIQIIQRESIFNDFIESFFSTFIYALLIGLVLSIIGAIYVTKIFLKRLNNLTDTMKQVKDKGIEHRVEISTKNDEFDKINIIFNTMMDDLEDSFNKQSRLIADASHEFRTPLTALNGHLNMIQRWGKYDEERSERSIMICLQEVERLTKMVNDLLVLSKSDNTNIDINGIEAINSKDLITETIENYKILNHKVEFNLDIQENIKIKIREEHLNQLLMIFIENAIKYNDKETVIIDIKLYKEKEKTTLSVKDNGIGIPEDEIPFITDRFYRADKSRGKSNNSFGLGLSIAKNIVENYKGHIVILSELGVGTEIKVEI
ncbi:sensor histidine kinase [Tissierella creatinophila]|uniref:histidine kinase n=1 Tax=Tissierella creatinophila DSM 6911 TaxID=1123403 RepID=A0A1U7M8E2_TISCR|nr:HAMP domain-containing sensor histidine kinase [Tissierella creatinophila]OLS03604.1 signal transduction histidine-protein kinase ArlS [Tissierella creatinophila DSM 6911]